MVLYYHVNVLLKVVHMREKNKNIDMLMYLTISFVLVITLFGCINIYKSCKIVNNQAVTNYMFLTRNIRFKLNDYFYTAENEAEHCKKTIEITINGGEIAKIAPKVYKYDKYKIPYLGNYINSTVAPLFLYATKNITNLMSIYLIFDPEYLIHKQVIGIWYTDIKKRGSFQLTDNGFTYQMYPESSKSLEWYYFPKKFKKGIWSKPYVDDDIKINMITYSAPIYSGGKFLGITGVDISIEELKNFIYQLKIYKTGKAYLIDQDNKIIFAKGYNASTSTKAINKNLYTFLESAKAKGYSNLKNKEVILIKSPASGKLFTVTRLYNGIILVIEAPVKELFAETIKLSSLTLFLLVLSVCIVSLITLVAGRKIKKINMDLVHKEKYTRTILDNIKDGIITINEDLIIESCNPAIRFIFEYSPSEIIGKKLDLLLEYKCDDNETKICSLGAVNQGTRKNGEKFPVEVDAKEISFENKDLILLVIRDITERKKIDKMKNEFISTINHELRTPLTSIKGALRLVLSGVLAEHPEKLNELIAIADKNCARLTNLIDDILDISKMDSDKLALNMCIYEISSIIKDAIELNTVYAEQFKIKLNFIEPDSQFNVKVDKNRLLQVFANLISNAVKFSNPNSTVTISVSCQNNMVRVAIADEGSGICEEFRTRIFEKFTQENSSDTRQKDGTGLGLNISKSLMEKMDGNLDFTTELGVGSTFYFDLPRYD